MVGGRYQAISDPLRSLEARTNRRLGDGNRMSGGVQVRFCELCANRSPGLAAGVGEIGVHSAWTAPG